MRVSNLIMDRMFLSSLNGMIARRKISTANRPGQANRHYAGHDDMNSADFALAYCEFCFKMFVSVKYLNEFDGDHWFVMCRLVVIQRTMD